MTIRGKSDSPVGYWLIDVPIAPAEVEADMELLQKFTPPQGVVLWAAEVIVHGRRWEWRRAFNP